MKSILSTSMICTSSIRWITLLIVVGMGLVSCQSTPRAVKRAAVKPNKSVVVKQTNDNKPLPPSKIEVVEQADREYVVRLIPERRESLWRIAEYEHIYNNPLEWGRIYNANRNIIDDPDLIYPGQHLIIPPIAKELE